MDRVVHFAKIKERFRLNPLSGKETWHVVLDLSEIPLTYQVGDCLAIYPRNDASIVEEIVSSLHASEEEKVFDKELNEHTFHHFLTTQANLSRITRKLLKHYLQESSDESLPAFLQRHNHLQISPQELCASLAPMLPRFYSIASSMQEVGKEAHLTIGRVGLCSTFLCNAAPLHQPIIPIYLQESRHFRLPSSSFNAPLIMIGPGTGVAPFRGFLHERIAKSACTKNWLFFGERNFEHDFYYKEYFQSLLNDGLLRLDLAFSRDQQHKIYVQDKMAEKGREIWQWLQEGAYIYVCGDAKQMAKAVDKTLLQIVQTEGTMDVDKARIYLKQLKEQHRYQKDVY